MKRKIQILISASAVSVLACSALAQVTFTPTNDGTNYIRDRIPNERRADQLNGAAKASDLIGMAVKNYQNDKLGKVEDLALEVESGRIVQVILSTGGFIGIGDTLTAVPAGTLHHDAAENIIHLDVTQEKLKAAPKFDASKWDESTQSNQVKQVFSYYSSEPYFIGSRSPSTTANPEADRDAERTSITNSTRTLAGTEPSERSLSERGPNASWSSLGYVQSARKLMGTTVQNLQAEKLGKVDNILVDLAAGRIVAVIVSSGGFLGLGDELSAIPPTALRFTTDRNTLQLDTSKELLSKAPHFKANQWPDFAEPTYVGGVYRAYQVEPYLTAGRTPDADNTRQNVRDRDDRILTPLDQGNSQADVDTTAQIRKEVIAGKNLSVNARNVKIITQNGRVTLRGPVNTAEEKRLIGEIADRIANAGNVDNQLEVQATTTSN